MPFYSLFLVAMFYLHKWILTKIPEELTLDEMKDELEGEGLGPIEGDEKLEDLSVDSFCADPDEASDVFRKNIKLLAAAHQTSVVKVEQT